MNPPLKLLPVQPIGKKSALVISPLRITGVNVYPRSEQGEQLCGLRVGGEPYRTQAEAAALLGLSVRDYSALESGRKTLSSSDWERTFHALLGLEPVSDPTLFGRDSDEVPS